MSIDSVRTSFAYGRWANRRLLAAAGELSLSSDERDRDLRGSFESITGTLRHLPGQSGPGSASGGRTTSAPSFLRPDTGFRQFLTAHRSRS